MDVISYLKVIEAVFQSTQMLPGKLAEFLAE